MADSFTRDELASYGKEKPAEDKEAARAEAQADETDETIDETGDEASATGGEERAAAEAEREAAAQSAAVAVEEVEVDDDPIPDLTELPMPDMSDEDVNFDNDKYKAKYAAWQRSLARAEGNRVRLTGDMESRVAEFK